MPCRFWHDEQKRVSLQKTIYSFREELHMFRDSGTHDESVLVCLTEVLSHVYLSEKIRNESCANSESMRPKIN